jgi:hypothetical protein
MAECGDAVPNGGRMGIVMRILGMLPGLACLFVRSQVILLSILFGNAMRVRGGVLELSGTLVVFVV